MAALREVFARFGFEFPDAGKLKQANSDVDKLKAGFEAVAAVFAGSALVAGIKQFAADLDVLDDLSAQTKIATDQLQVLGFAAELSGSSAQEMNNALTLLQKGLGRTTEATGPQVEALERLGIKLKDTAGAPRELATVLPEIFAGFGGLKSEAEKAATATALFGRSGVRLIPTLEKGAAGLAELRAELDEFGGIVDGDTIASAGEFRDNIARMDRAFFALKGTIARDVFPQLSKIIVGFAKGVGKIADWTRNTTLADTATKMLATSLGLTLAKALAPYLTSGLKFAAIFLAVDDVIAFLQGKDSVIGALLISIFGEETTAKIRAMFVDLWSEITGGFPMVREAWTRLVTGMFLSWQKFILGAIKLWNKLAPKKLQIDTSGVQAEIDMLQRSIDNIGYNGPGIQVPVITAPKNPKERRVAQAVDRMFGIDSFAPPPAPPLASLPPKEQAQRIKADAAFLVGSAPRVQAPNQTTTITTGPTHVIVQAPPGATARDVAELTGRAVRDANRQSAQALTQRAP